MAGGRGNISPKDNPKPFTKENQPEKRRGKGRKTIIKGLLDDIHESEGNYTFRNVEELHKSGPNKGQPTGRKVNVRIPILNAKAMRLIGMENIKKHRDFFKWVVEMESGRAVETTKLIDDDKEGSGFTVELK